MYHAFAKCRLMIIFQNMWQTQDECGSCMVWKQVKCILHNPEAESDHTTGIRMQADPEVCFRNVNQCQGNVEKTGVKFKAIYLKVRADNQGHVKTFGEGQISVDPERLVN